MTKEESDLKMQQRHMGKIVVKIRKVGSFSEVHLVAQDHTLRQIADYAAEVREFIVISSQNPWLLRAYNKENGVLEVELFPEGN